MDSQQTRSCAVIHSDLRSADIDAPTDLKATDVTLDSAVLTWIPPLADIEGYILTYRDEDGNTEVLFLCGFLTQTEKQHTRRYLNVKIIGNTLKVNYKDVVRGGIVSDTRRYLYFTGGFPFCTT